jgi:Tol biopolymer transport system component
LAALAFVHFRESPSELQAVGFSLEPPPDTTFANIYGAFASSPDGQSFVFAAATRAGGTALWLRRLDSMTARPLPGTENGNFPTWSPDSKSLAFSVDGKLKRIDIAGGAPLTLGDAPIDQVSPTGTWSRDGVILFGSALGLRRVSASGGGATLLTKVAVGEIGHGYPQFLPDGRRFLYFVASSNPDVQGVYAGSLADPGKREQVLRTAAKAVYVPSRADYPGYLLWMQDETLLAQRFDPESLQRSGDPISVAENIGLNPGVPMRAAFWVSDSGLLIHFAVPAGLKRPIVWVTRDGKQIGETVLEDDVSSPELSPDGRHIAMARRVVQGGTRANTDIWLWDFSRKTMTRLTFDEAEDADPVWSPDGRWVAWGSGRDNGVRQIYRKEASGAGQDERLTEGRNSKRLFDWSRDGRYLLYGELTPDRSWDLLALPLEGDRKPIALLQTPFVTNVARFSPDGHWIAYKSNDTGRDEVYVMAFPGAGATTQPSGKWQVSNSGASDMLWRDDGRELYFETPDGRVMAVGIQAGPLGVQADTPRALFSAALETRTLHSLGATRDGERFLLVLNAPATSGASRLNVISNWQASLRR